MNKIEAFKNELRNYRFYQKKLKELTTTINNVQLAKDEMERFKLLKTFSNELVECEKELDRIFTELTGFHAIRYDKEPSSTNEHLAEQVRLDLIDLYEKQRNKFNELLVVAENNLLIEMNRIFVNVQHIENVLDQLQLDAKRILIDIYCDGKKYEDVLKAEIYYSKSGLYKNINNELDKVLSH